MQKHSEKKEKKRNTMTELISVHSRLKRERRRERESHLEPALLTRHTNRLLSILTEKKLSIRERFITERTAKTPIMPLPPEGPDHRRRHGLPAAPTLCRVPIRVAVDTPRKPVLLDERRRRVERVAALGAEEVADVVLGPARQHHLPLDRRLAALAPGRKLFVVVEMAVKQDRLLVLFVGFDSRQELALTDIVHPRLTSLFRLGVKGDTLEMLATVMAQETFGVEPRSTCAHDPARDRQPTTAAHDRRSRRRIGSRDRSRSTSK